MSVASRVRATIARLIQADAKVIAVQQYRRVTRINGEVVVHDGQTVVIHVNGGVDLAHPETELVVAVNPYDTRP